MKILKYIFGLAIIGALLTSCNDDFSVDLLQRKFVRISKESVSLNIGEKMILKATTDTLGSSSETFKWSVSNDQGASIETMEGKTAIVTGVGDGNAVISIESSDGNLKYFTDLSVSGEQVIKILSIGNEISED
ncbi:MAG: Ig-like domain-containing protein, partial [Draconibacterium sp.]